MLIIANYRDIILDTCNQMEEAMRALYDEETVEKKSNVVCPSCKGGKIVTVKRSGTTIPRYHIPCGPSSVGFFITEHDYYCDRCKVKFHEMPPPTP